MVTLGLPTALNEGYPSMHNHNSVDLGHVHGFGANAKDEGNATWNRKHDGGLDTPKKWSADPCIQNGCLVIREEQSAKSTIQDVGLVLRGERSLGAFKATHNGGQRRHTRPLTIRRKYKLKSLDG